MTSTSGLHERRWAALAVLILPVLIISLDGTVLGFAIPHLSESLEPSSSQLLWIIDIYSFVLAGLLVTMGVLGDRIGRRRLLMIGAAGFSTASLIAAFSTSAGMLIGARAMLGVAGATLMPSTLSLIRNIFIDERERRIAIAWWAGAFAVGSAIGPIVGGFLLEHFWWGSVFLVGVPVTVTLLLFAPRLVPESRDPDPGEFDLVSALLSMTTMLPSVYAVKLLAERGPSLVMAISLAIGVASGVLFTKRQLRSVSPMIDLTLFRVPKFRMAVSGNLVACFGFAGVMFMITQYLQLVLDMSPLRAGIQLIPAVASAILALGLTPVMADRFGPFNVIAGGLAAGAAGFAMLTQVSTNGSAALATIALVILNAGLAAAMTVAIDGILAAVEPARAGAGAAVSETANELGVALGTAILGSVITVVYRARIDSLVAVDPSATDHARETLGAAVTAADRLPEPMGTQLLQGAKAGFVSGTQAASAVAAVALMVTAVWGFRTARNKAADKVVETV